MRATSLTQVWLILKAKADERGITFEHHFDDDYLEIEADEKLLERAFTNILSNAVRYAKTQISISGKLIENQLQITISNEISNNMSISQKNINGKSQFHTPATIKIGGAAKLVSTPPIDTLTNNKASVTYFNRFEGFKL